MVCAAAAALALAGCATAPAPDAQVSGTVFARERLYVPPDAYFEAALVDVTDDSAPPLVLARQRMDPAGPLPYALRIPYRQAQIQPEGRYEVRAAVRWRGRLLLDAPGVHPVLWTPLSRQVDVQLALPHQSAATATAAVSTRQRRPQVGHQKRSLETHPSSNADRCPHGWEIVNPSMFIRRCSRGSSEGWRRSPRS